MTSMDNRLTELEKRLRPNKPVIVLWEPRSSEGAPAGMVHIGTDGGELITESEAFERYQDNYIMLYVMYDKDPGKE